MSTLDPLTILLTALLILLSLANLLVKRGNVKLDFQEEVLSRSKADRESMLRSEKRIDDLESRLGKLTLELINSRASEGRLAKQIGDLQAKVRWYAARVASLEKERDDLKGKIEALEGRDRLS